MLCYSPKLKAIVVAFRGTYNVENILIDMDYKSIRYPNCPSAYVHRSFYQSMISLKPQLVRNMRVLAKKYSRAKIYFTGHSLGGALAVLSAAEVANLF
jgi:predicted lipase